MGVRPAPGPGPPGRRLGGPDPGPAVLRDHGHGEPPPVPGERERHAGHRRGGRERHDPARRGDHRLRHLRGDDHPPRRSPRPHGPRRLRGHRGTDVVPRRDPGPDRDDRRGGPGDGGGTAAGPRSGTHPAAAAGDTAAPGVQRPWTGDVGPDVAPDHRRLAARRGGGRVGPARRIHDRPRDHRARRGLGWRLRRSPHRGPTGHAPPEAVPGASRAPTAMTGPA